MNSHLCTNCAGRCNVARLCQQYFFHLKHSVIVSPHWCTRSFSLFDAQSNNSLLVKPGSSYQTADSIRHHFSVTLVVRRVCLSTTQRTTILAGSHMLPFAGFSKLVSRRAGAKLKRLGGGSLQGSNLFDPHPPHPARLLEPNCNGDANLTHSGLNKHLFQTSDSR